MEYIKNVQGSLGASQALVLGKDTVYVHTNIKQSEDNPELYIYDEIQYTYPEYIHFLSTQLSDSQALNVELSSALSNTQLALCDLYESMLAEGGK